MRLIDVDALLHELANQSFPQSGEYGRARQRFIADLRNAPTVDVPTVDVPTVDAVPVIRCKDCRFLREQYLCINGNNFPAHWCKQWAGIVPESGFCHLAERKEE